MKFSKVMKVKSPSRANSTDAGIDFYVPEFSHDFLEELRKKNPSVIVEGKTITLMPHAKILIPSGIKVNVPEGYMLMTANKSGVSSKKGLTYLAQIVDQGYSGQVHISLVNTCKSSVTIEENEKIIQFILVPVNYSTPIEVEEKDLYNEISSRGEGGFGSTDKI